MLTLKSVKAINAYFRRKDESNLWPIRGRFNVTERAIRRIRRDCGGSPIGYFDDRWAYARALEATISEIVNNQRNW